MIKKICIVGYGTITKNIIKNIANESDIFINIWSRTHKFSEKQIECSDEIEKLIEDVDLILSCVPDDKVSKHIWQHPIVIDYIKRNHIYCMEMSTLSYEHIQSWHRLLKEIGGKPIECPFTKNRRINSDKSISAFLFTEFYTDEIKDFINLFCNKIYSFSEQGEAIKFKLIYNTWGAEMLAQFSEMYGVVERQIKSKDVAWNILCNDGWMSLVCQGILPKIQNKDDTVGFKLKYMKKDVDYSESMFEISENLLYYATKKKFDDFVNDENMDKDFSLIVCMST